eukprot:Colp12_sorted_trinity150504_noHs@8714
MTTEDVIVLTTDPDVITCTEGARTVVVTDVITSVITPVGGEVTVTVSVSVMTSETGLVGGGVEVVVVVGVAGWIAVCAVYDFLDTHLPQLKGNVDLWLAVSNGDVNLVVGDCDLTVQVDIVQNSAISVRVVGHGTGAEIAATADIAQAGHDLVAREAEELVVNVTLHVRTVAKAGTNGLLSLVDLGNELVEEGCGVHLAEKSLTVLRVITTTESLLRTVVHNGNVLAQQDISEGVLEGCVVGTGVQPPLVVMVVDEHGLLRQIVTVLGQFSQFVLDVSHGGLLLEDISECVVHGVVQHSSNGRDVRENVVRVAVESLAESVNTSRLDEAGPEVLGHLNNSVDADGVKIVGLDQIADPVVELRTDIGVLLLEIGQTGKTAVLNFVLVVPVVDDAVVVVVIAAVEGLEHRKVVHIALLVAHVVSNHVNNNPDVSGVACSNKVLEILGCAKTLVDAVKILRPVSVVALFGVGNDGADPDGIETHALDVV